MERGKVLRVCRRHVALGWVGLTVFVALGLLLEFFHAMKWMGYLHVEHETRRMMLRLGHAHGTLLSVVQIAFGLTARAYPRLVGSVRPTTMILGHVLVPLGFVLGALGARDGDPGVGIALLPVGATAFLIAVGSSAWVMLPEGKGAFEEPTSSDP